MVKKELVEGERWDEITAICKDAVRTMLGVRLAHIGVNCGDAAEAKRLAGMIEAMFGFAPRETSKSWFAGDAIEYMSGKGPGTMGHIGFKTNSVERAMFHLSRQGVVFDPETVQYDDKGNAKFVYIKGEFGGFAIHLTQ